MEFFNKKQDVVDIQLTSYGKQLLSRGLFKPVYYTFSDDGVTYDSRWVTGSGEDAQQSDIETRIQEKTPRLKVQSRKVGAERAIFNSFDAGLEKGLFLEPSDLLEIEILDASSFQAYMEELRKVNLNVDFAEAEKLIKGTLGSKSFQNNFDPAYAALFYNGEISSSVPYYEKNDIICPKIPQLNCTLTDVAYRMDQKYDPFTTLSKPKNVSEGLQQYSNTVQTGGETQPNFSNGVFFENIPADPKTFQIGDNNIITIEPGSLFVEKDFLFLSLEEANVDFGNDNFMIEVFEITTTDDTNKGEEKLIKMFFQDESGVELGSVIETNQSILDKSVEEVFYFEVDKEINSQLGCYLIGKDKKIKGQSVYVDDIFDCQDGMKNNKIFINPYDKLPETSTGEVC